MDSFVKERWCILIIDEHALNREAISLLLSRVLPTVMVFEVTSVKESLLFDAGSVSLILLGLRPPYMKGFDMLLELRRRFPITPVVVLSNTVDVKVAMMARARGASGLFNTSGDTEDFLAAIQHALAGKSGFTHEKRRIARYMEDFRLSPRQAEVFDLLCKGLSNKEIGSTLHMSCNTVRTHVSAIFNMLGVRNRTEAVILGRDLVMA